MPKAEGASAFHAKEIPPAAPRGLPLEDLLVKDNEQFGSPRQGATGEQLLHSVLEVLLTFLAVPSCHAARLWKRKLPARVACGQSSRQRYRVLVLQVQELASTSPSLWGDANQKSMPSPFGEGRLLPRQELLGTTTRPKCSVLSTPLSIDAEARGSSLADPATVSSKQPVGDAGTSGGWPDVTRSDLGFYSSSGGSRSCDDYIGIRQPSLHLGI
ncbi:PREDICTED: uncharacterized protein LOC103922920 isoform X1 [Pygoscelis adeliae]|uniref:uncharacterized protein LOC103922920 isoform X1 n=1 Tax=Pygoscelis adeliae TaxID=9238 RepID=UPI0004F4E11B|nr:PREDICTED: uncharacterized protein LOC103922920 isoform X1 [Pygoscelis adeliae]